MGMESNAMGKTFSARQIRNARRKGMPASLADLHFNLGQELSWVHAMWDDFSALYRTGKDTIDILNRAAPAFFSELQRLLWEDILLHLCRLTDPPKSCGRDNLTVTRLPLVIPDVKLKRRTEGMVVKAVARTKFARNRRNRKLG
jgi:hypothetical protein